MTASPEEAAEADADAEVRARAPRWLRLAVVLGFAALGAYLVRDSRALPAIGWMWIYQPSDITSVADSLRFLANLQVPIPPYLALLEIWSTWLTGGTAPVTSGLYRFCLVGAYVLALLLVSGSTARLLLTAATSLLFLASSVIVHPGNPTTYDACFPFLVLAFLWTAERIDPARSRLRLVLPGLAGLLLSLLELTRPYALYLLPFLLLYAVPRLRGAGRPAWIAFFAPLVLLSGLWHANQLLAHGQITWSNHVGFNLAYAWPMVEKPPLVPEPDARLRPGRWKNLNTPEHGENSRRIRAAVRDWILAHPGEALAHALARLRYMLAVETRIYKHEPTARILVTYQLVGMLAACLVMLSGVRVGFQALTAPRRLLETFSRPEHVVAVVAAASLTLTALGDHGEEARFLISVLPLLALWPLAQPLPALGPQPQPLAAPGPRPQPLPERASSQARVASRSTGNDL